MGDSILDDPDSVRMSDFSEELGQLETQLEAAGVYHGAPPGIVEGGFVTNSPQLQAFIEAFDGGEVIDLTELEVPDSTPLDPVAEKLMFTISSMVRGNDCLSEEAERVARKKLEGMLDDYKRKSLLLNGCFTEQGRNGINYLIRHARPMIAFKFPPLQPLCALCIHPLGYFAGTWTGGLVPSDDIIAVLLMIRSGEEEMLWKEATQHPLTAVQAGF